MKKLMSIIIMSALIMIFTGCSNGASTKEKNELGTSKTINTVKITPKEAVYTEKRNATEGKDVKKVLEVTFTIKNEGQKEIGIGAGDFSVFDEKGNKLELYGYPDNFGEVIEPGKESKGKAYYNVSDGEPKKIVYEGSEDGKKIKWNIQNIKAEK